MPPKKSGMSSKSGRKSAGSALATKADVKRMISSSQNKVWCQNTVALSNTAAYDAPLIQYVVPSANAFTEVGEKCEFLYAKVRWTAASNGAAGTVVLRAIVFQWLENSESNAPTVGDILETASTEPSLRSGYALQEREASISFKIIKDFYIHLGENTSVEGTDAKYGSFSIKPKQLQRKIFRATGNGSGYNNIYMLVVFNIADASSPPDFGYTACCHVLPESTPEV